MTDRLSRAEVPMTRSVYAVRAQVGDELRDYVIVLPPESLGERGLPAQAIVGALLRPLGEGEGVSTDIFTPNPAFVRFMHGVIGRHAPLQEGLRAEAQRIGDGMVYVMDARTADPEGDMPREDVFGAVKVANGEPVAGSYRANPKHQLLTSRGFFNLGEELHAALLRELEEL
jgi:hypothetical protein